MAYKQTIDVKGLHSIPRSLSDNILRIPQNRVLIPVSYTHLTLPTICSV